MSAAGLGSDLYMVPQVDFEYLSDIAKTLAANPHARVLDKTGLPIPEALRGLQQDSVFPGDFGGPSPRVNFALGPRDANGPHENNVLNGIPGNSPSKYPHAPGDFGPSLPNQNNNFNDRFGSWTSPSADTSQPDWPAAAPPAGSPLGSPGPLTLEQAYLEYRSQMNGANAVNPPLGFGAAQPPQATTAVPAAPAFTPPRNASAWFAEMTGVDPNDPTRPAAMPDEDQLQAFVGRQPIAPWTLQRR